MATITTVNARVDVLLKDDATFISSADIDDHAQQALKEYSLKRPLEKVQEIAGDDSYDYSLPSDWVQGYSYYKSIEYPYDEQDPTFIAKEEWCIFLKLVGSTQTYVLRFKSFSPSSSEYIRGIYIIPHALGATAADTTIYANDVEAFCSLVTAFCLRAMANKLIQTSDSTIAADVVNYAAKSSAAASRAKEFYQKYLNQLGEEALASVGTKEFDTGFVWNEQYLSHKTWHR